MVNSSGYIHVKDVEISKKTGVCMCEDCCRYRNGLTGNDMNMTTNYSIQSNTLVTNGKKITSKTVKELENRDKRLEENRQKIQVIANTFCICQACGAHVKLLPEVQNTNEKVSRLTTELKQLKKKLELHKRGEIQLLEKSLRTLQASILWREVAMKDAKTNVKKLPLQERIPLYPYNEKFVCTNCYS